MTPAKKILITGNEACGEGAVTAGCGFYAGYPITPQNELTAYMSKRMDECGRVFIQSESELAAINMVLGASLTGERAMTTSSSPGISLMQEGISYLAGCQLPAVIVNVMRGGPGLGNIAASQADYFQATKGGGHGDYNMVILAPAGVQEMFECTYEAFDIAERYRNPVMILSDGIIGQMMEPIEVRYPQKSVDPDKSPWALRGCKGRESRSIRSLFLKEGALEEWNRDLQRKFRTMEAKEVRYETYKTGGARLIFVAYGTSARICRAVVDKLRQEGVKAGLFRPVSLWPFPYKKLKGLDKGTTVFFDVEMSAGQMLYDVRLAVADDSRVLFHGRMGGGVPEEADIINIAKKAVKRK
ncbi:MAG: 3-methyl-2-oxobutanoate dehydrogenase subunit VorB [Candidatus Omnitrophica bacterium]|nr:3-methyl-2-oxobutanoate dehydrogenase subunit VorB [Candidatus Omnitrophota bacterium]